MKSQGFLLLMSAARVCVGVTLEEGLLGLSMKMHRLQLVAWLWTRRSSPLFPRVLRLRRFNCAALSSSYASPALNFKDGLRSEEEMWKSSANEGRETWKEGEQVSEKREVQANWRRYARQLQDCVKEKSLAEGRRVHDRIRRNQIEPDTYLSNMLISMYAKCGSVEEAHKVFQAMVDKDVISWNAMISGFAMHGQGQEAVDLYYQMQREGMKPNKNTFVSLLSAVNNPSVLELGAQLHRTIIKAKFETDVTVGTALINMYCKCGSVESAEEVFHEMREPNVVSWTALISGYAQQGHSKEAFQLFNKLVRSGIKPNRISFVSILGACTNSNDLTQGAELHTIIKRDGLEQDLLVGNTLISMYARCGSLSNARQVFDNMPSRNVISWNAMISGYGESDVDEAFRLYKRMQENKIQPDRFTYGSLLSICADLEQGKDLHSQIMHSGWQSDVHVATALISMYTKCGSLEEARKVFNKMRGKNVVSWNAYIAACCRHGAEEEAFEVFKQMRQGAIAPDNVTFVTLLSACSSLEDGKVIHDRIAKLGLLSNNDVANALISMYGRCGSLADARQVFYRIRARDLGSWNAMMATFVQHGANEAALELFRKYRRERGQCDKYTFISALTAIANMGDLQSGRKVHSLVEKHGIGDDIQILTTLIRMYSKCGSLEDAWDVFDSIPERDVVCWNAMLTAFTRSGRNLEALKLFQHMQQLVRMKPDTATYASVLNACAGLGALEHGRSIHAQLLKEPDTLVSNALIEMYSKCGCLSSAIQVFKRMSKKRDQYSWNALIAAFCHNGQGSEALKLYERMLREGFLPNKATFTSVLSSCGQLGEVDETFEFLESMKQKWSFEPAEEHYACMVNALGREGLLKEAEEFIDEISPTPSMWESLLVACRVHQNVKLAETAAEHLLDGKAEASSSTCEQLLSVYAATGKWENVAVMKATMEETGMLVPKRCTMEVDGELHSFDTNPGGADQFQEFLDEMASKGFSLDPQERDVLLFSQSAELLAVAYAFDHTPPGIPVRCVTDTRITDLSHKMLKFVAATFGRYIFVRDPNNHHHFKPEQTCSCGDYW